MRADVEHREDVGVVQRRSGQRLLLKAAQAVRVAGNSERQNLEGNFALETGVASPINFAHAPRTKRVNDLIRAKPRTRGQVHPWRDYNAGNRAAMASVIVQFEFLMVAIRFASS